MSSGPLHEPKVVQALLDAFASIASETDEDSILEQAVDVARMYTSSRYGAAVLVASGEQGGITHLVHAGMPARQVAALPHPPQGHGVLGAVLSERRTVRLDRLSDHPASEGFPQGHVPMAAFLGVPLWAEGELLGALYLTKPPGHGTYSEADEVLLGALTRQVGAAVRGVRVAREAAGMAARLAAASRLSGTGLTRLSHDADPTETVREALQAAAEATGAPVAVVTHLADGVATFTHAHGDFASVGGHVGRTVPAPATLCQAVVEGRSSGLVPDTTTDPVAATLALTRDSGLRAYGGVPLRLPNGAVHGTLAVLSAEPLPLDQDDLSLLTVLAEVVGVAVSRALALETGRSERRRAVEALFEPGATALLVQPIVSLTDGSVVGVEALTRFPAAGAGPDVVFRRAAAERRGVDLELLAISRALEAMDHLPAPLFLSVNAGPATVTDPRLAPLLTSAPRDRVVLEITEHEDLAAHTGVAGALRALQAAGVRTAVDDTGAGFASLQAVLDLAPNKLKLDATLVRGVDADPARRALARAMVGLAAELGSVLIAEGIETQEELETLRDLGMCFGQGYHLGRPVPLEQLDLAPRGLGRRSPRAGDERRSASSVGAAMRRPQERGALPSPRRSSDGEARSS